MNEDIHVYCTHCLYFRLDDEKLSYCIYEDKCDINNCDDSMAFKYRPCYKER